VLAVYFHPSSLISTPPLGSDGFCHYPCLLLQDLHPRLRVWSPWLPTRDSSQRHSCLRCGTHFLPVSSKFSRNVKAHGWTPATANDGSTKTLSLLVLQVERFRSVACNSTSNYSTHLQLIHWYPCIVTDLSSVVCNASMCQWEMNALATGVCSLC
jgi:hypothetical protein